MHIIGQGVLRQEAQDKVRGAVKYNDDFFAPGMLYAHLLTSPYAHARIRAIDTKRATAIPGVLAVVTGEDTTLFCGEVLEDRPPLARGKVRYYGEPVAVVVAHDLSAAMRAADAIAVTYEQLPVVNSVEQALSPEAPLVHEDLATYKPAQQPVRPEPGSNVADRAKIRKGDPAQAWANCNVIIEATFSTPQHDHAAMEPRSVRLEIMPDNRVFVNATSQAPFEVQKLFGTYFKLNHSDVIVHTPMVGGAFGGKAAVQLEPIAYFASLAVGGRLVNLRNTREQDLVSSPVAPGMEATIKLGATRDGRLVAMEATLNLDIGAYTDSAPRVARAIASACTGPYKIDHVHCDVVCVYTNHPYTTAFRGFGYLPLTFAVERMIDKMAKALGRDPIDLRRLNAIQPGNLTPTLVKLTRSNIGDLPACLDRARELIGWSEGQVQRLDSHTVRAKGIASFWKTSSSPPNALSGALIILNADGTLHLNIGAVECGQGSKTTAAQILAEKLGMPLEQIRVNMEVNTQTDPEHWKTVASMATYMIGRAVLEAAQDVIRQLKSIAAIAMKAPPEDLDVKGGRVYVKDDPDIYIEFKDIARGYRFEEGDSIGSQIIGRGGFIMRHLTLLDHETGKGRPGPAWTVGVQAVEIELNTREFNYRFLRAATVMDAGKLINPKMARGIVLGGMAMGLGYATREGHVFTDDGRVLTDQFRTYRMLRVGEEPSEYLVDFIETPQLDAPYGARPIGEHGVLAIPAALANAVAAATGAEFDHVPVTPERIWQTVTGGRRTALDPVRV